MKTAFIIRLLVLLFSFSLFLRGFFPFKQIAKGYESQKLRLHDLANGNISLSNSQSRSSLKQIFSYRRVILFIIDAFRADFAFGPLNYLPSTRGILNNGHGLQFIAEAHPPTVTLPRIKAITTGSTPSFLDVVLNFGSSALEEDNIVTQMKRDGRRIVFFGDDTWISLFPGHFERSDGTSSFFVSDYTEVDLNVTRHLKTELHNPTWDVMILHYLGLDHIGHIAGPSSPLIRPKLAEMDKIIKQIYEAMELWSAPSLLVVCGDHGMSDQGGHGGASAGEVSVPVLFLSPHIVHQDAKHIGSISQVDLCPTLSVLMDLPIPKNNLGKVVTEVLIDFTLQQKVYVAYQNAERSLQVLKGYVQDLKKESSFMLYAKAQEIFHAWVMAKNSTACQDWENQGHKLLSMFSESLGLLAERVSRLATQYDVYAMAVAMVLQWMLLLSLVISYTQRNSSTSVPLSKILLWLAPALGSAILSHLTMCTCSVPSDLVCHATQHSMVVQLVIFVIFAGCSVDLITGLLTCTPLVTQIKSWRDNTNFIEVFLLVGTVAHTFTLLSSSYVEEEHQTFYFLTITVHLLLLAQLFLWFLVHHKTTPSPNLQGPPSALTYQKCGNSIHENTTQDCIDVSHAEGYQSRNTAQHSQDDFNDIADQAPASSSFRQRSSCDKALNAEIDGGTENRKLKLPNNKLGSIVQSKYSLSAFLHFTVSLVMILIILRILRRWNQTGNKWLDLPDFGDWLILPENKNYLSLVVIFSLMIIAVTRGRRLKRVQSMCVNLSFAATYCYRVAGGSVFFPSTWFLSSRGILEARASFVFIGATVLISLLPNVVFRIDTTSKNRISTEDLGEKCIVKDTDFQNKRIKGAHSPSSKTRGGKHGHHAYEFLHAKTGMGLPTKDLGGLKDGEDTVEGFLTFEHRLRGVNAAFLCFMCLVLRPHNIPVVALMSLVEQMITPLFLNTCIKPTYLLLYCLWMGQAFFFFQGNSNSLSTVDLTAGYTGLHEFMPAVTGCLLLLATYSGSIFWVFAYFRITCLQQEQDGVLMNHRNRNKFSAVLTESCTTLLLSRALPLSVYLALASAQRYHLFVWTVFSPKLLYEGTNTLVISALAFFLSFFAWCKK